MSTFLRSLQALFETGRNVFDPGPRDVFAKNLKRLRESSGLSQEELADRAGVHRTYISLIERCQRSVSLEVIFVLAKALGTNPAELLTSISKEGNESGI